MKFFSHGILGMNARNLRYIRMKNSAESISLADSKLKTKTFLSSRWIPFAETYFTIKTQQELNDFSFASVSSCEFVIKPNKWSWGKGILIVTVQDGCYYVQGDIWTEEDLRLHMTDILHGSFSLHGTSDTVVIEEKLIPWFNFSKFCKHWLADIRIIVYNFVPVTAMIRMPTIHSGGKANLAQWWVWLGLNIANGEIITFFQNKTIYQSNFPGEFSWMHGMKLPFWDDILLYSSQVQMYTKLGYLALDWVITSSWPKLLEINARAWLEIQNVNLVPLDARLRKVEDLRVNSPLKGVEIAKTLFHSDVLSDTFGKKVLFLSQYWSIEWNEVLVEVDISTDVTRISEDIFRSLSKKDEISIDLPNDIKMTIKKYDHLLNAPKKIILWRNDIEDFLISPKQGVHLPVYIPSNSNRWSDEILDLDKLVYKTSKKINLSSLLRPENYFTALDNFIKNPRNYNPIFQYHFPDQSVLDDIEDEIKWLNDACLWVQKNNSAIASLYFEKLEEMHNKLELVRAYKDEKLQDIIQYNQRLFWSKNDDLLLLSKEKISQETQNKIFWVNKDMLGKKLTLPEVIKYTQDYFAQHAIEQIPITIENGNLSRMSVSYGKTVKIHISRNAQIYEKEIQAILAHEIGTHFQRYLKWKGMGLKLFQYGTGYYLTDEEGFAIHQSLQYLPEGYEKNAMYIKYYLLSVADTLSFSETIDLIRMCYPEKSEVSLFSDAIRLKRGITHSEIKWTPWTTYQKDKIYLDGYMKVKKWIENGWEIEKLFYWKIKIQDIPLFEML